MLAQLRVSPEDEQLYHHLLRAPGSTAAELARAAGCSPARARAALGRLVEMRLVERRPGRPAAFEPSQPDVAIASRVNDLRAALDEARLAIPGLLAEYQRGRAAAEPGGLVEVRTGPGAALRCFLEIRALATEELRVMTDDPALTGHPALRRGVRSRGLYAAFLLAETADLAGARLAPHLPLRVVIGDRRLAMLPLMTPGSVLLVKPSSLLDDLIDLFDDHWARGYPVRDPKPPADGLAAPDLETLRLLATGLKDEAIARQLGVSMRTARRRISGLLARLGAESRFQAGAEAARRGLL
jgi:DNA-binding CsgD family transcriptional regulator